MQSDSTELRAPTGLSKRWFELSESSLVNKEPPRLFELAEDGQPVVHSPLVPSPSRFLGVLCAQLLAQLGHEVLFWTAVSTPAGVLRPDLIWQPEGSDNNPTWDLLDCAPPLLIELELAGRPRHLGMAGRVDAFLRAGTREVAVVTLGKETIFHRTEGASPESVFGLELGLPHGALPQARENLSESEREWWNEWNSKLTAF
jgi:hypothetical protein